MEKTKTRRAPERPTAATAPAETATQEKVISKPKKRVIKRAVKDVFHC